MVLKAASLTPRTALRKARHTGVIQPKGIIAGKFTGTIPAKTPIGSRYCTVSRVRELLMEHMEELTMLVASENGKTWSEAEVPLHLWNRLLHSIHHPEVRLPYTGLRYADGRDCVVKGYENGYFIGPTVLDHVTEEMSIGQEEAELITPATVRFTGISAMTSA